MVGFCGFFFFLFFCCCFFCCFLWGFFSVCQETFSNHWMFHFTLCLFDKSRGCQTRHNTGRLNIIRWDTNVIGFDICVPRENRTENGQTNAHNSQHVTPADLTITRTKYSHWFTAVMLKKFRWQAEWINKKSSCHDENCQRLYISTGCGDFLFHRSRCKQSDYCQKGSDNRKQTTTAEKHGRHLPRSRWDIPKLKITPIVPTHGSWSPRMVGVLVAKVQHPEGVSKIRMKEPKWL